MLCSTHTRLGVANLLLASGLPISGPSDGAAPTRLPLMTSKFELDGLDRCSVKSIELTFHYKRHVLTEMPTVAMSKTRPTRDHTSPRTTTSGFCNTSSEIPSWRSRVVAARYRKHWENHKAIEPREDSK